jgi:hypothetical protein
MESSHFDNLTKALATTTSRRQTLKAIAATLGGLLGLGIQSTAFAASECRVAGQICDEKHPCCMQQCLTCDNGICVSTCRPGQICQDGICLDPITTTGTTTATTTGTTTATTTGTTTATTTATTTSPPDALPNHHYSKRLYWQIKSDNIL